MPHGCCYLWNSSLIALHVVSDLLIALAYYSIPVTLVYFVRKRQDLVFSWIYLCFALFIISCGTTHLMEVINIWYPNYWLSGTVKAATALASVPTAILLFWLVPKALAWPTPEQLLKTQLALEKEKEESRQAIEQIHQLKSRLIIENDLSAPPLISDPNTVINENDLPDAQDPKPDVRQLNIMLQRQAELLETSNKELEAFSYSVSHDLRAPLRHIDGFIDLLRRETSQELNPQALRYLDVISNSARQMGTLIDDLLVFARTSRDEMRPTLTKMDEMVSEVRTELEPETTGRNIDWKIAPLPELLVDRAMCKQIWVNLLSNAVKYTSKRDNATIEVGCLSRDADYEFFVRDNGAGFDMRYASKLFGIFQRLHRQDEFEGNGIGLANVRRIVSRHGGAIRAEGQLNIGATFYFTLPKQPLT
jgi:signal transduction histidine kinase